MAPGNGNGAGNQQQMMMMIGVLCVCCVCVIAIGAGIYFMRGNNDAEKKAQEERDRAAQEERDRLARESDNKEDTSTGGDMAGVKTIKYGGTTLVVPPKAKCNVTDPQKYKVYLNNGSENDQHHWKFIDVPGRSGTYYVRSEHKMFRDGCPLYLTSPQNCNDGNDVGLDKAGYAERQYWKVEPKDGGYQLVSTHCENQRQNRFLTSRGVVGAGKSATSNTMRMVSREGAIYKIEGVSA
jgi:hypothetical protein